MKLGMDKSEYLTHKLIFTCQKLGISRPQTIEEIMKALQAELFFKEEE